MVRQINALNKLVSNRTEDETILKLLDLLLSLSVKHYVTEEYLMNAIQDYADKEQHITEHRLVIEHITKFRQKLQQELVQHQHDFKDAIKFWLAHMFTYDEPMVDLLIKQGLLKPDMEQHSKKKKIH